MTTGVVSEVQLGPGTLYCAPVGTTEPASASATLASAFREIGYTESGSEFQYEIKTADIDVAEEFDPVRIATTGRAASISFEMAQVSRQNLALALNIGANAANDASSLEPVSPGSEVRVMLVWQGDNGSRWIFRQCFQSSPIAIKRDKAPQKALIPVTFRLEKPSGSQPFKVFPAAAGLVD